VTVDAYVGHSQSAHGIETGIVLRGDPKATTIPFPGGAAYYAGVVMWQDDYHFLRFGSFSNSIGGDFPPIPDTSFVVESADENYHLRFSARGPELTVSLWRVVATNGIIRETPVRFLGNGTNTITASDTQFSRGIVGIAADNSSLLTDYAFFDDVTIKSDEFPPSYAPSGSSTATVVPANWVEHWGELTYTTATPAGTSLTVDVLDSSDALLAADVSSGTALESLTGVASQRALRLRANFLSAEPSLTPTLSDWTITFPAPAHNPTESSWSGTVSSTIDTSAPRLTITSPEDDFLTSTNVVTFTGTASDDVSGVRRVRVRAITATTTNAYANWTANAPLRPGTNIFSITAEDNAVLANGTTLMRRVIYQP
jgi:hypothetical protein